LKRVIRAEFTIELPDEMSVDQANELTNEFVGWTRWAIDDRVPQFVDDSGYGFFPVSEINITIV
jgi:hypothetical protein